MFTTSSHTSGKFLFAHTPWKDFICFKGLIISFDICIKRWSAPAKVFPPTSSTTLSKDETWLDATSQTTWENRVGRRYCGDRTQWRRMQAIAKIALLFLASNWWKCSTGAAELVGVGKQDHSIITNFGAPSHLLHAIPDVFLYHFFSPFLLVILCSVSFNVSRWFRLGDRL